MSPLASPLTVWMWEIVFWLRFVGHWLFIVTRTLGVANKIYRLSLSIFSLLVQNMADLICFMASLVSIVFILTHCVSFGPMIGIVDTSGVLSRILRLSVSHMSIMRRWKSIMFKFTFCLNLFLRWRGPKCSAMNFRKVSLSQNSINQRLILTFNSRPDIEFLSGLDNSARFKCPSFFVR